MPAERNAFRLGLALIAFFVLFCTVLWFLAPTGGGDMLLQVRFPHDQFGTVLKPGGEVLCGGNTIGSIRDLRLETMTDESSGYEELFSVATIRIDSAVGLRADCRIVPTEALLGGMGALVIRDRGLGEPVSPGAIIDGEPATSIADLTAMLGQHLDPNNPAGLLAMIQTQLDPADARSMMAKLHNSLDDINVVTRNIAAQTDVADKAALLFKLHEILRNVNIMTSSLRDQTGTQSGDMAMAKMHEILDQLNAGLVSARGMLDENREPIRRTITHVESTSRILEEQIAAKLAEQLDTSNAAGLLARIHRAIERMGRSLDDINRITGDVRDVVALNKHNLDAMIRNLKETSDHLKAGSKEIRLNPWLLLYTPRPDEVAQAYLSETARAFAEGATRLDDALARLTAVAEGPAVSSPERQEEIERIRLELNETFEQFNRVEQKLWEQLKIR